jgi:RNA polymerase sigma-70 factor, ECF subfamily
MMKTSVIPERRGGEPGPELFTQAAAGDREAFGGIVRHYQNFAYAVAMRTVWDAGEAEDIVQEAFVKVWLNIGTYRPEQKFTTWLYAIVVRIGIDHIRRKSRWSHIVVRDSGMEECRHPSDEYSPDSAIDDRLIIARLRECVGQLPRTQRMVFTLRDLEDMSMAEVMKVTGLSATSVKANLWHGRKRLRELLGRFGGGER